MSSCTPEAFIRVGGVKYTYMYKASGASKEYYIYQCESCKARLNVFTGVTTDSFEIEIRSPHTAEECSKFHAKFVAEFKSTPIRPLVMDLVPVKPEPSDPIQKENIPLKVETLQETNTKEALSKKPVQPADGPRYYLRSSSGIRKKLQDSPARNKQTVAINDEPAGPRYYLRSSVMKQSELPGESATSATATRRGTKRSQQPSDHSKNKKTLNVTKRQC